MLVQAGELRGWAAPVPDVCAERDQQNCGVAADEGGVDCRVGTGAERREALARLEVIADTFLSMNAPVQCALPAWLAGAGGSRSRSGRGRDKSGVLDQLLLHRFVTRLEVEAGWYAVLRVPALESDEDLAVRLVEERGVYVHPGYFFGFAGDGWWW